MPAKKKKRPISSTPDGGGVSLRIGKKAVSIASLKLIAALDRGTWASVVLAESLSPPARGDATRVQIGGSVFGAFNITDYDLPRESGGGSVQLADPVLVAPDYGLELMPPGKTSYGDALTLRLNGLVAGKELFGEKHPALAVDGPVISVLNHACAQNGWHWFRSSDGKMRVGSLPTAPVQILHGLKPADRPDGCRFELTDSTWPNVGVTASSPFGDGTVVRVELLYHSGAIGRCFVTVGHPARPSRAEPRASFDLPAVVSKVEPFEVKVVRPGQEARTASRLVFPTADGGKCQLRWPVRVGDGGTLVVAAGGVCEALPSFYPEAPGKSPQDGTLKAETWIGRFGRIETHAKAAEDTLEAYAIKTSGMTIDRI